MASFLLICPAAFFFSLITLFSGFGLGTLLLPFFSIFFPVETAVAMTAVVHLMNNIFKTAALGRYARWKIVAGFGIPAAISAFAGAAVLLWLAHTGPFFTYSLAGKVFEVTPVKLLIAVLIFFFAVLELLPQLRKITFPPGALFFGGVLSGFFGGLSGHQGAFRSAFLIRLGLSRDTFIGTGVIIACMVDFARLAIYGTGTWQAGFREGPQLLVAAVLSALAGVWAGKKMLGKMTLGFIHRMVAVFLLITAAGMALGLI